MFCSACGVDMPDQFRFCSQCGTSAIGGRPQPLLAAPLRRSRTNKKIAGVCGGLGSNLGIDPTLVRLIMVCAAFWGFGLVLYVLCWIVMPSEPPVYLAPVYPVQSPPQASQVRY